MIYSDWTDTLTYGLLAAPDTIAGALTVRARRLLGSAQQVAYEFDVVDGARSLVSGRASVMLEVA